MLWNFIISRFLDTYPRVVLDHSSVNWQARVHVVTVDFLSSGKLYAQNAMLLFKSIMHFIKVT